MSFGTVDTDNIRLRYNGMAAQNANEIHNEHGMNDSVQIVRCTEMFLIRIYSSR